MVLLLTHDGIVVYSSYFIYSTQYIYHERAQWVYKRIWGDE